jgi:hypothetical protein
VPQLVQKRVASSLGLWQEGHDCIAGRSLVGSRACVECAKV